MNESMPSCPMSCTDKISIRDYYKRNCTEGSNSSASNFYKLFIDLHEPGDILLVNNNFCDNVKYTVQKGWTVDLLPTAPVINNGGYNVNIINASVADYRAEKKYSAIALNFLNLSPSVRLVLHREISKSLNKGGYLLLEEFVDTEEGSGNNAVNTVGQFEDLEILYNEKKEINLVTEQGMKTVNVLRLLARKL